MTPEEIGDADKLGGIMVAFDAMHKEAKSAFPGLLSNERCYCLEPLVRLRRFRAGRCESCFQKSGRVYFQCINGECAYKRETNVQYEICLSCVNLQTVDEEGKDDGLIRCKLNHSIAMIS